MNPMLSWYSSVMSISWSSTNMVMTCFSRSRPRLERSPSYCRFLSLTRTATFLPVPMTCFLLEDDVACAVLVHLGVSPLGDEVLVAQPGQRLSLVPVGDVADLAHRHVAHAQVEQLGEAGVL